MSRKSTEHICKEFFQKAVESDRKSTEALGNVQEAMRSTDSEVRSEGAKYDDGKVRYSLVPVDVLREVARVLTIGARKYADNNWKLVPNAKDRYTSALMRHFEAWRGGELRDPEMPECLHLAQVICNAMFLMEMEKQEKGEPS